MPLQVNSLSLTNFRNYRQASWRFGSRTVVVGENATGKTNILEALFLLASTKSFRAVRERELLRWGESAARIEIAISQKLQKTSVIATLAMGGRVTQKAWQVNGQAKRGRDLIGRVPMALFTAADSRLIDGSPGRRRRALDLTISQGSPIYHQALGRYSRVLATRNRLLEQVGAGEADIDQLEYWDDELVATGQLVIDERRQFTEAQNKALTGYYREFVASDRGASSGSANRLEASYQTPSVDLGADLGSRRDTDIAVGTTSLGPHRDDWQLLLGNRPLGSFGSGGEYRSAMLAWRLAELSWLKQHLGVTPVLLLDDVFSELDEHRRRALAAVLPSEAQVILTTPEARVLPGALARDATIIDLGTQPTTKPMTGGPHHV